MNSTREARPVQETFITTSEGGNLEMKPPVLVEEKKEDEFLNGFASGIRNIIERYMEEHPGLTAQEAFRELKERDKETDPHADRGYPSRKSQ